MAWLTICIHYTSHPCPLTRFARPHYSVSVPPIGACCHLRLPSSIRYILVFLSHQFVTCPLSGAQLRSTKANSIYVRRFFFCVPCIRCSSGGNRQNCGIFLRQRFRRSDCSSHRGTLKFICTPHIRWPGGILGAEFVSVKSIFFANLCRKVAIIVYPLPRNLQYVLVFR